MYLLLDLGSGQQCYRKETPADLSALFNIFPRFKSLNFTGQQTYKNVLCNVFSDANKKVQFLENAKNNYPVALIRDNRANNFVAFNDQVQDRKVFVLPVSKDECQDYPGNDATLKNLFMKAKQVLQF